MSRLLIVRGLPGAGKSTYVMKNYPGLFVLDSDSFHCVNGQYEWTANKDLESISMVETIRDMLFKSKYKPDFCITGVFSRIISFLFHVECAIENGYEVYIKTIITQYKSTCNIPKEEVEKFKKNFISDKEVKNYFDTHASICDITHIHYEDLPKINWK